MNAARKTLKVTLTRSLAGRVATHRACANGLGLRRLHQSALVEDSPCTRGMINKISYMIKCEEVR